MSVDVIREQNHGPLKLEYDSKYIRCLAFVILYVSYIIAHRRLGDRFFAYQLWRLEKTALPHPLVCI